jgi:adenylate cyclase class 2
VYEVELKVRADHEPVRETLGTLGATPRRRVRQVDTYYDAPHRDFAETDEAFRLRREFQGETETAKLTYKGPLVEAASKTREEHEVEVSDGLEADAIAEGLGFTPAATVEKDREFFEVDDYTVTLDAVDGLGTFVEVEIEVEDDIEPAREGAADLLGRLGLDPEDQIRTSYLGLLLAD